MKQKKKTEGTPVQGTVLRNYVQVNVLPHNVKHVAEELSQLVLTEYYRQFGTPYESDTNDEF